MVDDISCKTLIVTKLLCIRFDKTDGFNRVYDSTRYLVLFGDEKYYLIYNRIRYLKEVKTGVTYVISPYYAKIKIDLYDYLPLEIKLTFHNVALLTKFLVKIKISDTAILNISGADYGCIRNIIGKNEAINLVKNINLTKKRGTLQNVNLFSYIKVVKEIITF